MSNGSSAVEERLHNLFESDLFSDDYRLFNLRIAIDKVQTHPDLELDCTETGGSICYILAFWESIYASFSQYLKINGPKILLGRKRVRINESGPIPGACVLAFIDLVKQDINELEIDIILHGHGGNNAHSGVQLGWKLVEAAVKSVTEEPLVIYLYPAQSTSKPGHDVLPYSDIDVMARMTADGVKIIVKHIPTFVSNVVNKNWNLGTKHCLFPKINSKLGYNEKKLCSIQIMVETFQKQENLCTIEENILRERIKLGLARAKDFYNLGMVSRDNDETARLFGRAIREGLADAYAVQTIVQYYEQQGMYREARWALDNSALSEQEKKNLKSWLVSYADIRKVHLESPDIPTLTVLGGGHEIGGSCYLLTIDGKEIILDAGLYPQPRKGRSSLPDLDSLDQVDLILISHAHLDHIGALPKLHYRFPQAPIIVTPSTANIAPIVLEDAQDVKTKRSGTDGKKDRILNYYEPKVISETIAHLSTQSYDKWFIPFEDSDLEFQFWRSGHILGAAGIWIRSAKLNYSIVYTGDFCLDSQRTVAGTSIPPDLMADSLIMENTYNDSDSADRSMQEDELITSVGRVLARGGTVLIPAFAVGRAQEVALILSAAIKSGRLPKTRIYLDGLVRKVAQVYDSMLSSEQVTILRTPIHEVRNDEQRKIIWRKPNVIISSSGMLAGGPSCYYARMLLPESRNAIIFTGYQDEDSPGAMLKKLGRGSLRLDEEIVDVRCEVLSYRLSAHAGRNHLLQLISILRPKSVILIHGEPKGQKSFVLDIKKKLGQNITIHTPRTGDTISLLI